MYCKHCGNEINHDHTFCGRCGQPISETPPINPPSAMADEAMCGWMCMGFCVPLIGLILWAVWREDKPQAGNAAGLGALIAALMGIIPFILAFALGFLQL